MRKRLIIETEKSDWLRLDNKYKNLYEVKLAEQSLEVLLDIRDLLTSLKEEIK